MVILFALVIYTAPTICETGILLIALFHYIGDPNVIDHFCELVRGGLRPEPSLDPHADNVIIPLNCTALLSQFHARCRSPFRLHNQWSRLLGGALWRACNLTSFSPCLTSQVDNLFASRHKGPGFKTPEGYLCETGILLLALSRYILISCSGVR